MTRQFSSIFGSNPNSGIRKPAIGQIFNEQAKDFRGPFIDIWYSECFGWTYNTNRFIPCQYRIHNFVKVILGYLNTKLDIFLLNIITRTNSIADLESLYIKTLYSTPKSSLYVSWLRRYSIYRIFGGHFEFLII